MAFPATRLRRLRKTGVLRDLVRDTMPFLFVMVAALALIMLVPDLVLYLPRLFGYKG